MKRVTLKQQVERVEARKQALGITDPNFVPANAGGRRTASKVELLRMLHDSAEKEGRELRFQAAI